MQSFLNVWRYFLSIATAMIGKKLRQYWPCTVQIILKAGINPNKIVAMMAYNDIVKWYPELVSYGAKIDLKARTKSGLTPTCELRWNCWTPESK